MGGIPVLTIMEQPVKRKKHLDIIAGECGIIPVIGGGADTVDFFYGIGLGDNNLITWEGEEHVE